MDARPTKRYYQNSEARDISAPREALTLSLVILESTPLTTGVTDQLQVTKRVHIRISSVPLHMCRLRPSSPKGAYSQRTKNDFYLHFIFPFIIAEEQKLADVKEGVVSGGRYFKIGF